MRCPRVLRWFYFGQRFARSYVEVLHSVTARTVRTKVERRAIPGQRRPSVLSGAIDRSSQVHGPGPGIARRLARCDPQVKFAEPTRATGVKDHLQSVPPDSATKVSLWSAEFPDQGGCAERTVRTEHARIGIKITKTIESRAYEVEGSEPCLSVLEIVWSPIMCLR